MTTAQSKRIATQVICIYLPPCIKQLLAPRFFPCAPRQQYTDSTKQRQASRHPLNHIHLQQCSFQSRRDFNHITSTALNPHHRTPLCRISSHRATGHVNHHIRNVTSAYVTQRPRHPVPGHNTSERGQRQPTEVVNSVTFPLSVPNTLQESTFAAEVSHGEFSNQQRTITVNIADTRAATLSNGTRQCPVKSDAVS